MPVKNINKAWEFNCTLQDDNNLKSWFYADTEQDAKNRIADYMGAKLKSIKEIDDPLEVNKKQIQADKIRISLQNKREKEHEEYLKKKEQNDSN
jgi:hypothetical protein